MGPKPTAFIPKRIRIIVIGAGISGIQFLKDAKTQLQNIEITIYDKNDGEGGTWFENRYPGCACDIPSHAYQYSWNPNPHWSRLYAEAPEILNYLQSTVDKFDLRKHMIFNTKCVAATWDESSSEWTVSLQKNETPNGKIQVKCDVFVSAVGRLNNWKLPQVDGLDHFRGPVIHTANWPEYFDLHNKDIAIIGNGASSIQCLAGICKDVKSIGNFVRGPTWLVPHVFSQNGESQVACRSGSVERMMGAVSKSITDSKELIRHFEDDPEAYFHYRLQIERQLAGSFEGLWADSEAAAKFTSLAEKHMSSMITDLETLKALLPTTYKAGCRRFTPADRYMEALNQTNIELISDSIERLEGNVIYTSDGKSREYDAIVCGTGFDPYTPRFSVAGRDGAELSKLWSHEGRYQSYLAVSVADFPNFFVFNPPICPVNGSAYPGIERASDYMIKVIERLQKDRLKSVSVKASAQAAFNQWVQSRMHEMVWTGPCSSWYKLADGKVIVPWPGTILHYYAATEIVRWEDYDLKFEDESQKFASFGNGITLEGFNPRFLPWLKPSFTSCSEYAAQ